MLAQRGFLQKDCWDRNCPLAGGLRRERLLGAGGHIMTVSLSAGLEKFIEPTSTPTGTAVFGDLNHDGRIGPADLLILESLWHTGPMDTGN